MIEGETVRTGATDPGTEMQVLSSMAGFYLGFLDRDGLPYSRESEYFQSYEDAQQAMINDEGWRT